MECDHHYFTLMLFVFIVVWRPDLINNQTNTAQGVKMQPGRPTTININKQRLMTELELFVCLF